MPGTAYGVGVGPGDPELMTFKAARLIRSCPIIAVPGKVPTETVAYKIAAAAVPEIANKALLPLEMPMVRDGDALAEAHRRAAKRIERCLDAGKDVACLTLGDPSIYSTFAHIQRHLEADGYDTALVSGVPSFCAAAARLNAPLTVWDEPLRVFPAAHGLGHALDEAGTCVLMKSGGRLDEIKGALRGLERDVGMVENCGMPDGRVCRGADGLPDAAGYFSLIIATEKREGQP